MSQESVRECICHRAKKGTGCPVHGDWDFTKEESVREKARDIVAGWAMWVHGPLPDPTKLVDLIATALQTAASEAREVGFKEAAGDYLPKWVVEKIDGYNALQESARTMGAALREAEAFTDDARRDFWQMDALRLQALAERDALIVALREVERHCPCGARPETPGTHPHVGGCPVGAAPSNLTAP